MINGVFRALRRAGKQAVAGRPRAGAVAAPVGERFGGADTGWVDAANVRAHLATMGPEAAGEALQLRFRSAAGQIGRPDVAALRRLPQIAPTRATARDLTIKASRIDRPFRALAAQADRARDMRSWRRGVEAYDQALALYPYHPGYRVQRGHCHKEAGNLVLAEIDYRDALAYGAPAADVWPHLVFVHAQTAQVQRLYPPTLSGLLEQRLHNDQDGREDLTTSEEAASLIWLFHGSTSPTPEVLLRILRLAPLHRHLAAALMDDPAFYPANRVLVAINGRAGLT